MKKPMKRTDPREGPRRFHHLFRRRSSPPPPPPAEQFIRQFDARITIACETEDSVTRGRARTVSDTTAASQRQFVDFHESRLRPACGNARPSVLSKRPLGKRPLACRGSSKRLPPARDCHSRIGRASDIQSQSQGAHRGKHPRWIEKFGIASARPRRIAQHRAYRA